MWDEHLNQIKAGWHQGRKPFDPELPSILCIHGAGGTGVNYRAQLHGLKGFNVASLDLPGHGETPGTGSNTIEGYAAWLADFLAAGPVRPVLLGHSMGGAIAQVLALTRPELIRALVLVGTGARLRVLPAILDGLLDNFAATVPMILKFAYAPDADLTLIKRGVEEMAQTRPSVLHGDFTACDRFDVRDRLSSINLPTLVMVGEADQLTPVKYAQSLAEAIPGARLEVIPKGGHMVYLEEPQAFNQALTAWLEETL